MGNLSTLANLKGYLGKKPDSVSEDDLLERLLAASSTFLLGLMERDNITSEAYTEYRSGNGSHRLATRNSPVTAVAVVMVDDREIPASAITFNGSFIYLKNGYRFTSGWNNVILVYTAGLAAVPADLDQLCIELAALRYKERDRLGETSKNIAGQVVSYSQRDLPAWGRPVVDRYKRVVPL